MLVLIKRVKTKYLLLKQKKFQNKSKNICEVYQSESFRCIMSLSYRVTFLCNVLEQTHYTSESPVRFLFYEKSCKVVNGLEIIKQLDRKLFFEKVIPIELLLKKKPLFSITFLEKVLSGISVPGTKFQMHRYSEDGL